MIGAAVFFLLLFSAFFFYLKAKKEFVLKEQITGDLEREKLESPIERRLDDALILRGEYVKSQVPCGKYRIDLTLPAYRIAIECDGKAYHSSPEQKAQDRRKNAYLRRVAGRYCGLVAGKYIRICRPSFFICPLVTSSLIKMPSKGMTRFYTSNVPPIPTIVPIGIPPHL
ncbi:endonuclease domain-containing protein [Bacillus sp. V5-8f]|uniref:endonuclease domain-containing protein n=1 Tax=Bacillus sp. V5-8f TaxID=2053044 RepID=UPI0021555D0C|nr:hypothetical protein [Bacillus sp. V5-8f]